MLHHAMLEVGNVENNFNQLRLTKIDAFTVR